MAKGLLLLGAGGHARSCVEAIESAGLPILGLLDHENRVGEKFLGYPILGTDDDLQRLLLECAGALVTVGHIESAAIRIALYKQLVALGAARPTIAAKSATLSRHAVIGSGTIVMHGAIINAGARVGENAIINSGALVEHDSVVDDHVHVSTGALVNGNVTIGQGSFVGSGAILREGVTIGPNCVIGAGSVILDDCPADTRFRGGIWPRRSS